MDTRREGTAPPAQKVLRGLPCLLVPEHCGPVLDHVNYRRLDGVSFHGFGNEKAVAIRREVVHIVCLRDADKAGVSEEGFGSPPGKYARGPNRNRDQGVPVLHIQNLSAIAAPARLFATFRRDLPVAALRKRPDENLDAACLVGGVYDKPAIARNLSIHFIELRVQESNCLLPRPVRLALDVPKVVTRLGIDPREEQHASVSRPTCWYFTQRSLREGLSFATAIGCLQPDVY